MKKLICLLTAFMILGASSFAQDAAKKQDTKKAPAKTEAKKSGGVPEAGKAAKPEAKKSTPVPEAGKDVKTKKDGTPDKRYKENREGSQSGQKMKKDGTPDMRYKQNKEAANKK